MSSIGNGPAAGRIVESAGSSTPYRDRYAAHLAQLKASSPVDAHYRAVVERYRPMLSDVQARSIMDEMQRVGQNPACFGHVTIDGRTYRTPWAD